MCEGGRVRHHLMNNLGDAKNLVLFIGYCADGTLGNQITAGKTPVNIFGDPYSDVRRSQGGFARHLFRPRGTKNGN